MKITLYFQNLDNFMGTKEEASVSMEVSADDEAHLYMLANHLRDVLHADYYVLEEV